jgi:hypothetical protein
MTKGNKTFFTNHKMIPFRIGLTKRFPKRISFSTLQKTEQLKGFLKTDFETVDLPLVHHSFVQQHSIIRDSFLKTPFWKLFWNCDYFVDEVKTRLRNHGLVQAEFQMVFAAGKIAGTAANVDKDASLCIDPYALRNEIAAYDESILFNNLSLTLQSTVRNQYIVQVFVFNKSLIYGSLILAVHFGIPIAVAVPSGLLVSSLGLSWMNHRYSAIQSDFVSSLHTSQKTLESKLKELHASQLESFGKRVALLNKE